MVCCSSVRSGFFVLTSTLIFASCGGLAPEAKLHGIYEGKKFQGRYIVALNESHESVAITTSLGILPLHTYRNVMNGFAADLSAAQLKAVLENHSVKAVYEAGFRELYGTQSKVTWGIDRLDQTSKALDGAFKYAFDGRGVTAYVIDTGINIKHPDFEGRAFIGSDFSKEKGTARENLDGHGHGTHVAGTVGSKTWGVAKGVKLVAVKVFDSAGSEADDTVILAGIDFAIADHKANPGPAVINMSIGGKGTDSIDAGVKRAVEAGIVVVVAAGNNSANACRFSPAREPSVITVGAFAKGDRKSSFSNWGPCVDVLAPGSHITSTSMRGTGSTIMAGTSMASPHVAGVAAVVLSAHPEFTVEQATEFIKNSAQKDAISGFRGGTPNLMASVMWNLPAE